VVETANAEKDFVENAWIGQIARDRGCRSTQRHWSLRALRDDNTPSGRSPEGSRYPPPQQSQHNRSYRGGSTPLYCRVARSAVVIPSGWSKPTPGACRGPATLNGATLLFSIGCLLTTHRNDLVRSRSSKLIGIAPESRANRILDHERHHHSHANRSDKTLPASCVDRISRRHQVMAEPHPNFFLLQLLKTTIASNSAKARARRYLFIGRTGPETFYSNSGSRR